jgi:hypothetical protein
MTSLASGEGDLSNDNETVETPGGSKVSWKSGSSSRRFVVPLFDGTDFGFGVFFDLRVDLSVELPSTNRKWRSPVAFEVFPLHRRFLLTF